MKSKEILPLPNLLSDKKKLLKNLRKIDSLETKRFNRVKEVFYEVQESNYTVEHAKKIIDIARYYSDKLLGFELSKEKEEMHLNNIRDLKDGKYGKYGGESSRIEEILNSIQFFSLLEERLNKKGLIQKQSPTKKIVNRIACKEGDSE